MGELIIPAGSLEVGQVVRLGSLPRIPKLGHCVASSAPRAMVRDLAQHEGLHPRLRDCFSWTWNARASADAYQRQLEEALGINERSGPVRRLPMPDGTIIDVEPVADDTQETC